MQRFLNYFRSKIQTWRDRRFLKKHGCKSWDEYNYRFDPDRNQRAPRVKDYYCGYPYWTPIENRKHLAYYWDVHEDGIYILSNWCKENLSGKFRFDFLRVMNAPATAWQWEINEIGGRDYIFFACKDERDLLLFTLRWGA